MNVRTFQTYILVALISAPFVGFSQEKENPIEIFNRVGVEYDDNIRQASTGEASSLKISEDVEFVVNFDNDISLFSMRYNPSFTYWENRPEDDTDLHHQFDLVYDRELSPRAALSIKDVFRLAELPELIDDGNGVLVREDNDFIYNSISGGLNAKLAENLTGVLDVRHSLLAYDDADVASINDYETVTVGADIGRQLQPRTGVEGQARFTSADYEDNFRNYDAVQFGAKFSHHISPRLQGTLRAGYETRSFDTVSEDASSPYADGQLTCVVARDTRVNGGLGLGLSQTPLSEFASSDRVSVYGGVTHDLNARLTVNLSAQAFNNEYSADEATGAFDPGSDQVGTEDVLRLSARVSYKLNPTNWLEAGWQYAELDSEVRSESNYERNRLHVGWKINL
jgi:hypothetical protein